MFAARAAIAAALPAQWAQITPTTPPSARRLGGCAWDSTANRLIFYGGIASGPATILSQTWSYNGTWTQLAPAGSIARWGHRLVRNTQNNHLITFGGRSPTISAFANDTQEWTGTAWTNVATTNAPSARYLYGLAFDQARNVAVLFGGRTNTTTLGDTWEYNGINWVERTTPNSPPPREDMVLVYDPGLRCTVLFGGLDENTNTLYSDTWRYDGTDWVQQSPTSSQQTPPVPPALYSASGIFDSTRKRIVIYGGYTGSAFATTTYEYTGDTWNTVTTSSAPAASTDALNGYDPVRKKFALFGGYGGTFLAETWEYSGANTAFTSHFGPATPTEVGEATITSTTLPRTGQAWSVTFANMPSTQEFLMAVLGLSNTTWGSVPLPVDLGIIGLPGAQLLVSPDVVNALPTSASGPTNVATNTVSIPNNTALLNATVFVQGLLLDLVPTGTQFIGTTQGLRAVIGS
jgi:hypothetical protein